MSSPNAVLSASELTLSYGNQRLLDGVSLAVGAGEKVGLVGRNGCGKTSLLKILAGQERADGGDLSLKRELRVGYLPQDFELDGDKTVLENIQAGARDLMDWVERYESGEGSEAELGELLHQIEAVDGWNLDSRIKSNATALSAPALDAKVGPLSGGEKRRVALCRALASQPDLLLLDEPTNHLDAESIRWLESYLEAFPGAVIFVTHDRYFLDVIATRIIELDLRAFSHPGNYTAYLEAKAVRQVANEQKERRRQRFLRVELEWVRSGVKARGTKPKHRMESFYKIEGQEAPAEEREMDLLMPPAPPIGNIAVELIKASAKVGEGEAQRWLFRNLSFTLKPGQCTGIVGRNGAGKTTLLRLCMGTQEADEGKVTIGKKAVYNYIDQGRMHLNDQASVLAEVADQDEVVFFGSQSLSARSYLRRFLFADERANELVKNLSGGERARLMLAKVLKRGGNIVVLDEPTNDLDLPSLRMLEEAIADFDGSVLVVSHDRYFLDRICDQIVAFEEGNVFVQPGNYSYYLEKKKERDDKDKKTLSFANSTAKISVAAVSSVKTAKPRKLSFKEQEELKGMESAIHEAESRAAQLESLLHEPSFYVTRSAEAAAMLEKLEAEKANVARLYKRWEELEAMSEASMANLS